MKILLKMALLCQGIVQPQGGSITPRYFGETVNLNYFGFNTPLLCNIPITSREKSSPIINITFMLAVNNCIRLFKCA